MTKFVFRFDEGETSKELLGGKGAGLASMTGLGLPIPAGFTITTSTCIVFLENGEKYPDGMWAEVEAALKEVEKKMGKKFGDPSNPLLVSVRSGAKISMPGMMDTVLNVGLNKKIVEGFAKKTGNERFVKDAYRRLIQMFANVVCGLDMSKFEELLEETKKKAGVKADFELKVKDLDSLIDSYLELFKSLYGSSFPDDPMQQIDMAVKAVFKSWNNKRAIAYRNFEGIPHDIGTAVNIQSMVFGNYDDSSGTGVMFSRNPSNGQKEFFGEYLLNAQGEDVVAGIRTPHRIQELEKDIPEVWKQLLDTTTKLEDHYKDMQDIEFTIQEKKLFMLQTRTGKRTGPAAAKIAVDMVSEGVISKEVAVGRITPRDVESSLFPSIVWRNKGKFSYYKIENLEQRLVNESLNNITKDAPYETAVTLGEGLPAGPGSAAGHVVFDSDLAEKIVNGEIEAPFEVTMTRKQGDRIVPRLILVKKETSPEDFHGMVASVGILTMTGGLTSHAALVGRQIGKRVIVGAGTSYMDLTGTTMRCRNGELIHQGDPITIDIYEKGLIFNGELPIVTPTKLPDEIETILDWADGIAKIKVRANADKENDTTNAMHFKATGTGLARTEHQFFDALELMQQMILAETEEERNVSLEEMGKLQKQDFVKLFRVTQGKPVTIRLLDPPLHEFLPKELEIRNKIWTEILDEEATENNSRVLRKVIYYQEANPMLGLRGCRLGLLIPRIIEIQSRAIIEAALQVTGEGLTIVPEIMVPLIGSRNEFLESRKIIDRVAKETIAKSGIKLRYSVGTMIEIPRAALTADEIAEGKLGADFFSFGTNDLHQMTLGFSRDDVGKFLPFYLDKGIIDSDPFQTIDEKGVGKLMSMCIQLGRKSAADAGKYLKAGICGEQGGDPKSIDFCYRIGLDYVSCSPFRVPVARLAAAHATLNNPEADAKYGKVWPTPKVSA